MGRNSEAAGFFVTENQKEMGIGLETRPGESLYDHRCDRSDMPHQTAGMSRFVEKHAFCWSNSKIPLEL
ncbi:hypothetical protein [Allofournierella massiliensis]|uniref:hypothetical protein n=1 Tax=Allofournierella massiliensis TaxID=1650663 RepID=UPI0024B0B4F8|nr:hypothetical protein [Fournierella massiliensis]